MISSTFVDMRLTVSFSSIVLPGGFDMVFEVGELSTESLINEVSDETGSTVTESAGSDLSMTMWPLVVGVVSRAGAITVKKWQNAGCGTYHGDFVRSMSYAEHMDSW